jgi:LAO/AO transport system kinase
VPGMGDDVQAMKAGIMEIADIFVVNKADRDGADRSVAEIESLLGLHPYKDGEWRPPIVRTQATTGQGIQELDATIARFRSHSGLLEARRRQRAEAQLRSILAERLMLRVESALKVMDLNQIIDSIVARTTDAHTAAAAILAAM